LHGGFDGQESQFDFDINTIVSRAALVPVFADLILIE
jgi:hypothetical protein